MKLYKLEYKQQVNKDIETVFKFFENPHNLAKLTPSRLEFKIITPEPLTMRDGLVIDYTIKVIGLSLRWTTYIQEYQPPHSFIDLQLSGPYSLWHHRHTFIENRQGTLIEDSVDYALKFGKIGEIIHAAYVRKELEQIFHYRSQVIADHFR